MAKDSARFLPMLAESLNDIYSKIEETNSKIGKLEHTFQEFLSSIGQKNMIIIQNLKKLQGTISDLKVKDNFQKVVQGLKASIKDIQDGIWFLEFQKALSIFKEKFDEL